MGSPWGQQDSSSHFLESITRSSLSKEGCVRIRYGGAIDSSRVEDQSRPLRGKWGWVVRRASSRDLRIYAWCAVFHNGCPGGGWGGGDASPSPGYLVREGQGRDKEQIGRTDGTTNGCLFPFIGMAPLLPPPLRPKEARKYFLRFAYRFFRRVFTVNIERSPTFWVLPYAIQMSGAVVER